MTEQQQASPRRLTRSTTDRMLGGVCGGLAEFTGIDPVVFRVVFAVATIMGGAGLIAYIIAWLVIPPGPDGTSYAESLLHDHRVPRVGLIGIGIVALVIVASLDDWGPGRHWGGGGFGLLVLLAIGVWLWTRNDRPAAPRPPAPPAPPRPLVGGEDASTDVTAPVPPVPAPIPLRRRERSALPRVTVSALLITAGILAAVDASDAAGVHADTALAICLLVVGAGLLVGATFGRARGLIGLGVLLTVATAVASVADVPLSGGAGDRRWDPVTGRGLERRYELGVGEAVLDLRDLDLRGGSRKVQVSVGIGHLLVELPPDADVHIDAHAGFGNVVLPGIDDAGVDVDRTAALEGPGDDRLELDLKVGMGQVEVTR